MAKKLNKRKWLNPPTSEDTGAVQYSAKVTNWNIEVDLAIWDCSRKIDLAFSIYSPKQIDERLKKIAILRESLDDIEEYLTSNIEEYTEKYEKMEQERKLERAAVEYL